MFVFATLQIPSGVCRFVVGVLHPRGYGPGLHREYFCFGGSYIMMNQFTLTFLKNLLKYPPEPDAFALMTRQQVLLQCQNNLPVHGVRTERSSESQGYTRVSQQNERLNFSRKTLHIGDNVVTDWRTVISVSSQYFLLPQDYDRYSEAQRMFLS